MKNIILILSLMLLPACDYLLQEKEIEVGTIENYDFEGSDEIPEFKTIDEAFDYANNKRQYTKDGGIDYFQTPEETFYRLSDHNKMRGDCEDYALFFSYILYSKLNIDSELIIIDNGIDNHVLTYIPSINKYLDPTCRSDYGETLKKKILYRIPYTKAIWMAINYHEILY